MASTATLKLVKSFPQIRNLLLTAARTKATALQTKLAKDAEDGDESGDDSETDNFGFLLNSLIASLARLKDGGGDDDDDASEEKSADATETLADVIQQIDQLSAAYDTRKRG